jgi:GMP synthase-like glutamine amidotransferase
MRKILLVQSMITEERIERQRTNFTKAVGGKAELDFISAVDEKLSWTTPKELLRGYDGVIFGGSYDFDFHGGRHPEDPARVMSMIILNRSRNIVQYASECGIAILGVCFGHQIIGEMHRGMVSNDREQSKMGSYEVSLTEEGKQDRLFKHLPESFYAQYAHKDSVTNLPEGATLLASSPVCKFAGLRYGEMIYTVQFHPEVEKFRMGPQHPSPESAQLVQLWLQYVVG